MTVQQVARQGSLRPALCQAGCSRGLSTLPRRLFIKQSFRKSGFVPQHLHEVRVACRTCWSNQACLGFLY